MNRISTFQQHNQTLENIRKTQLRLNATQVQIGSGRQSQDFAGVARQASRLVTTEASLLRNNQYIETNELIENRLGERKGEEHEDVQRADERSGRSDHRDS